MSERRVMYFLLKEDICGDLKIINSKDYKIEKYINDYDNQEMLLVYEEDGRYRDIEDFNQYYIIKQSENVYDLIEVGDLIEDDYCIYQVSDITYKGYSDNRRSFVSQPADFKHHEWNITAIYKQDSKENYIKVWRKE